MVLSVLFYDSFVLFVSFVVFSCYWRIDSLTLDDVLNCEPFREVGLTDAAERSNVVGSLR